MGLGLVEASICANLRNAHKSVRYDHHSCSVDEKTEAQGGKNGGIGVKHRQLGST